VKAPLSLLVLLAAGCAATPPSAAPPPPPPTTHAGTGILVGISEDGDRSDRLRALSDEDCRGLLAVDVAQPPYRLEAPPELSGQPVTASYKVLVGRKGKVFGVEVVDRPSHQQVWGEWMRKLRTWRYRPYLVDGQPVGFSCPVRIEVR
jgi:hypothetical protein